MTNHKILSSFSYFRARKKRKTHKNHQVKSEKEWDWDKRNIQFRKKMDELGLR